MTIRFVCAVQGSAAQLEGLSGPVDARLGSAAGAAATNAAAGANTPSCPAPTPGAALHSPLAGEECGRYARRISRFLGCSDSDDSARPTHLVARAALNRCDSLPLL
jgi:hypothetical protein